ncbi:MAG: PEP-CTERM sorting domain-containing protein [Planctomycetota bacterium]
MHRFRGLLWVALCGMALLGPAWVPGRAVASAPESVYFVGNSLTWDSRPHLLPGLAEDAGLTLETGFFIRANSSLAQSWEARDTIGNVESTHPSMVAGLSEPWDAVVFQPHNGRLFEPNLANLGNDRDSILNMIALFEANNGGPAETYYLHEAWLDRNTIGAGMWESIVDPLNDETPFVRSEQYLNELADQLRDALPGRTFEFIPTARVFEAVYDAILNDGTYNMDDPIDVLFRDRLHANNQWGRPIAMWTTFATLTGVPASSIPSEATIREDYLNEQAIKAIIDDVVFGSAPDPLVPEPTTAALVIAAMGAGVLRRRARP